MSTIIEIESAPRVETQTMLEALAARGVRGALIDDDPRLRLVVSSPRHVRAQILAALADVVGADGMPRVPEQVDEGTFAIRPPAG